jgi:hypothetical protein
MEAKARTARAAVYLALACFAFAARAGAEDGKPVVIGEVASRVTHARVDVSKALRRALERELAALEFGAKDPKARYVLSASLVKLEERKAGPGVKCAVSAVLRERQSGAIRAIITGRAEADAQGDEAELGAIDAAVRGAVASVPAAMR